MRFALAIIAALANAAGPWLCCCAMSVMVGTPLPAKAGTIAPVKKSAPKCSHCEETPVPGGELKSQPAKPAPAKPCPCKERQVSNPTTVQPVTETATTADVISHDFNLVVGPVEIVLNPEPAPSQVLGWPFMTTETRLHVHHVLRC
ncbi:hypothetical protein [Limnoglobus roseus]|uniref:Secreted protein n=1 Tax=Limnoglobus roseus TaxID=2598579 RepID=A0A5C1AK17_9BACT|nr:hypothetical protein [Limnoglobus roseus]QEL17258.1 hypothetical protein PX52LOC_04241 [Limnoglobus roseus]